MKGVDPVSLIVAALAAGAAAGLKDSAAEAVKDAYAGIKTLIASTYRTVDLSPLEQKPESEAKRASLAEDLKDAGAEADAELLERAKQLVEAVRSHDAGAAAAVGVDLEEVTAGMLRVGAVTSAGTGVRVRRSDFAGDIDIGEVRAGVEPKQREGGAPENPS